MDVLLLIEGFKYSLLIFALPIIGYYILSTIFPRNSKNVPPGPREWGTSWKFIKASWNGTLPLLATEWAKKYGEITFVYSLGHPVVFLNTAEISRNLLASDKYKYLVADRPLMAGSKVVEFNGKDLVFTKFDAIMRKKRRMFHKMIGMYGDGVEKFEKLVWGEMERMFTEIDSREDQEDIDITKILVRSLKIIIYILVIGEPPADPNIPDVLEEYDLAANKLLAADVDFVLKYFPFLSRIPGKFKNIVERAKIAKKIADELVYYNQKRTHVPDQPRGITDILIDFQNKPGYEWMKDDEEHIIAVIATLFMAAHLTSRATLYGIFLCLLNYPEVTKKIQEEVDRVIGDQQPILEHKTNMPYTEASILEVLRLISQLPLSGFRLASEDIDFEGMVIPKDSLILMNNWYFLHDENVWKDPWSFKPERFLDSEGQLLSIDHPVRKCLISFGIGLRACPGEIFSRSRMFIFITGILQRYDIAPAINEKLMPANFQVHDENIQGLVRQTPDFKCRLTRRKRV